MLYFEFTQEMTVSLSQGAMYRVQTADSLAGPGGGTMGTP